MTEGERDVATFDRLADSYQEWVADAELLDDATFADLVGPITGQNVLVLGCGQGRESRLLARAGAQVTGVDVSERLLDLARAYEEQAQDGIVYVQDDAQHLTTLDDACFDGAVCYLALMDIPDLPATVKSLARVVAAGGWLVITITHPCFKPPVAGELLDHRDGRTARMVAGYFEEGPAAAPVRSHDALPQVTHHRMLSTYLNETVAAGFTIERAAEPPMPEPCRPVWREVPVMLYLRCRRV